MLKGFFRVKIVLRWAGPPGERQDSRESQCRAGSASLAARTAVTNAEGIAQRRDFPRKAWGHGAAAIEPPHVGRVLQRLQKSSLVSAHETLTALTEILPHICGDLQP
ncbi:MULTISPECIES: hypothetical protein [unclassified Brenneria]|uniref:hypothetical protein n=1 Tax=unclassified Brenneria TaxID=2634434 RepID=UPI0015561F90|nr:hypothetical protein [Brenneria sp. hezel4-2-4]MEE3649855.1 hypothetical protein [Brenneria sp. HEZEL_4_2_4]NPC99814.1 hypothetical protein [Brenneria sp. hezel4-2-4]